MIKLFLDTDSDITPEIAKKYDACLISMPYIVNDKVIYPYRDFETFKVKEFYDMLRKGTIPTTCAVGVDEYIQYFEPVFANGDDILYIHFSAAMTATFNSMHEALAQLKEKYPERKLYEIDTKAITLGSYGVACEISDMLKEGKPVEEVVEKGRDLVDHFACYFFADDLKFFKRSGRVSGLAAFMGGLIGIRPIITMDDKGVMRSISKEKGLNKTIERLVNYVKELGDDVKNHKIAIGHTDALELAKKLGDRLQEEFNHELDLEYVPVNPTAGSHCGPNAVGVTFHAKHR